MEFCPNCGAKIEKNAEFCGECGYEFKKMKGIRPKQQISKKALAFLIVVIVYLLIINVQNIGAIFIPPKTLNLNTVTPMTLFSNLLAINPDSAFFFIFFVVPLFWGWLRIRYKSGMKITKVFVFLLMLVFILSISGVIPDETFINIIFDFLILATMLLIACDFCFFVPKAKHNWVKASYCICICFIMMIINTFFSHIYEEDIWDNRDQTVANYVSDIKKVLNGDLLITDTDNGDQVSCFDCKLKKNDHNYQNGEKYSSDIQERKRFIYGDEIDYLPDADFSVPVHEYQFSIPDQDNSSDEDDFVRQILDSQTEIDIYINKSGKITCEAFNGKMKKEKKDGKIVFDYYPDGTDGDTYNTPFEIESNN